MEKGVDKRGLSPIIASVLMILLVLVLASIIFLWARGFISEQIEKFGKPVEELCSSIDFEVVRVGDDLEIINRGDIDIHHLDVKLFEGGNSEIGKFNFQIDAGDAVRKPVTLTMSDGSSPDKITVYPALVGNVRGKSSNKVFTCIDAGVTL
ncbi:MAG: hypothetical protein OEL87_02995 [Nanoarchaeota archaeon]|nr:hypothetical protein [Nanoarchaeota archaeon]